MAVEGREQVTRIRIIRVNGQPEELDGSDGRRQPSMGGTSRVSREAQARICERLGVKFPGATRLVSRSVKSACWAEDEGGSFGVVLQEKAPNSHELLQSKAVVVNVMEKA
jgi:hypothetical protein